MFSLNLPQIKANIRQEKGKNLIFDPIRRRFVALTPEEWVRQNFTSFLINYCSFPASLMGNEISITLNGMTRRCDTVVYSRNLRPLVIVEYKAPTVPITHKTLTQACTYNLVLRVPYIMMSNGLTHYCCHIDYASNTYTYLRDVPSYSDILAGAGAPPQSPNPYAT